MKRLFMYIKRLFMYILLLQGAACIFAQTTEAFIKEMTGTVELKTPGSADWTAAKAGDRLDEATLISTGFKSMAILAVGNSSVMVKPLTRLSVEALVNQNNTETINLGLSTGRIQAEVKPPSGMKTDFTVRSPMATASVRGTSFSMDPVNLAVSEGSVSYVPSGGTQSVVVGVGQNSWVDNDSGKAVNPVVAAETSRSLPALAGTPPVSVIELPVSSGSTGSGGSNSPGSLNVKIILNNK